MRNRLSTSLWRICALAMVLVMCISLFVPGREVLAASGKVTSVTVTNLPAKSLTLKKGKSFKLKTKVTVSGSASKKVTYKSSKKSVATVNSKGKITAKKKGTAKITITSQADKKKKYVVTVKVGTPVKKVTLNQKTALLNAGSSLNLKATLSPKKPTNKKVVWSSGNENVARVDSKGVVTAVNAGTAKITCTAADGSNKKAVCTVTVVKPQSQTAGGSTKAAPAAANTSSGTSSGTPSTTPATPEVKNTEIKTLEVDAPSKIAMGTTGKITASAVTDPSNAKIIFSYIGDNPGVAEIKTDGSIVPVSNGVVNVTVTAKAEVGGAEKTDTVTIQVYTAVERITLDKANVELFTGQTAALTASVLPGDASNGKVTFTSDNETVAAVSSTGLITAKEEGTANITVASDENSEITAVCSVIVKKLETSVVADTAEKVKNALENPGLQELIIRSDEDLNIEIPKGTYNDVSLVIDAPKGHIENHANFKSITIKDISKNTLVEYAVGNTIIYEAKDGTIEIKEGAVVSVLDVAGDADSLNLVNNGSVTRLSIDTNVDLTISGSSQSQSMAVEASENASDTNITTSQTLRIVTEVKINLNLRSGSERTSVVVNTVQEIPDVSGVGTVSVTIQEDGDRQSIIAENDNTDSGQTAAVTGRVINTDNEGLEGVSIALIKYSSSITAENAAEYLDGAVAEVTSTQNGSFTTEEIPIGNYCLFARADGYKDIFRSIVLTSENGSQYSADTLTFVKENATEEASFKGFLTDAQTTESIGAGLTVRIRKGYNNNSGNPLMTTTSDEESCYYFTGLEPGDYTIQVIDNRGEEDGYYDVASFNVTLGEGENTRTNSLTFNRNTGETVFFVLSWGDEDSGASADLDSHLSGPTPEGGHFHTWYSDQEYYHYDEVLYDDLDWDDTDYVGPETTTIRVKVNGVYHFYVHDYSNKNSSDSDQMARSNAVVKMYDENGEVGTYTCPNLPGNLWHVLDYDSVTGKVSVVNEVSYWKLNLEDIGDPDLVQKYQDKLEQALENAKPYESFADDETKELLEQGRKLLEENSDDVEALYDTARQIEDWVDTIFDGLYVDVEGDEIDYCSSDYENDELERTLEISGYGETLNLDQASISVDEDSSYEIKNSETSNIGKMIVVTNSRGISANYHIQYTILDATTEIKTVTAYDSDENSLVDEWWTDTEYDEDASGNEETYRVLTVTGCAFDIPESLSIKPKYPTATVSAIAVSDRIEYEGMFTITAENISETYYLDWFVSDEMYQFESIQALNEDGINVIEGWANRNAYDDDGNLISCTYIYFNDYTLPDNLTIEARYTEVSSIMTSDKPGYDAMVTVGNGKNAKNIYLIYKLKVNPLKVAVDC